MSLNSRYKLVLRPEFPTIDGVRSLNGLPEQPFLDNSGNIDMSGNFLLVKNIEAGTQDFTTNGEKGIINVYSESTTSGVSCINFKHDITNIGGNNRRYSSFQPNDTNFIAGSITGNPAQVSYNTTSDLRLKTNIKNIGSVNNDSSEKYSIGSDISFNTWLGAVSQLKPRIFEYNTDIVGSGNNHFTYKKTTDGDNISVNYQGFIAGEVQEVYPPAVTGISGETVDSNPVYQQLDVTKLIPMMVGSIQELMTRPSGGLSVPDGILDISGDILRVKNIEAGTQDFTVNDNTTDNKGVINVFSDSSANKVANINFKNTNTYRHLHQNENSRSYSEYQTIVDSSNITTGIISGGNFQTTFGVLMDDNLMELCDSKFGYGGNSLEYSSGKYVVPDRGSTFYIDGTGGAITYDTWLQQINALDPYTYYYKSTTSTNGKFNAAYRQGPDSPYQSNGYIPYQGFLGSNVLNVYPPAVINSSSDTSNNQYVDMTKLIPMCIGAIKQLDASMNSLSTNLASANTSIQDLSSNLDLANAKLVELETLSPHYWIGWNTYLEYGDDDKFLYVTIQDGSGAFDEYVTTYKRLISPKWGASQYNSTLDTTARQDQMVNSLDPNMLYTLNDISGVKFVYDFTETTPDPTKPLEKNYKYSYYMVDKSIPSLTGPITSPVFAMYDTDYNDQSGKFGLIYDTGL